MATTDKPCYGFALSHPWLCLAFGFRLISSQNKIVATGLNIMFSHNNNQRLEERERVFFSKSFWKSKDSFSRSLPIPVDFLS